MYQKSLVFVLCLSFWVFTSGCKKSGPSTSTSPASSTAVLPPVEITDEEKEAILAFGSKIEETMAVKDPELLIDALDLKALILDSVKGVKLPRSFEAGFEEGLQGASQRMGEQLTQGRMTMIGYREVRGQPGLLFRMNIDGGLEYSEYAVRPNAEKKAGYQITEIFNHTQGFYISDLLRNNLAPIVKKLDRSLMEKILGSGDEQSLKEFEKLVKMSQLVRSGDKQSAETALGVWKTVDAKTKSTKFGLMVHLMAQSVLFEDLESGQGYLAAIQDYEASFPNDASLSLLSIDKNLILGDFDAARKNVRDLKASLGDDYLALYEGYIDLNEENFEKAEAVARAYIEVDPDEIEAYEILLEAGFGTDNHQLTAEALTVLTTDFEEDYSGLLEIPEWKPFRKSKQGEAWINEFLGKGEEPR